MQTGATLAPKLPFKWGYRTVTKEKKKEIWAFMAGNAKYMCQSKCRKQLCYNTEFQLSEAVCCHNIDVCASMFSQF